MGFYRTWLIVSLIGLVEASGYAVKRQVSQLRESYDFVIAGGGTSGLTVADRLTGAFPNSLLLMTRISIYCKS